MSDCFELVSCEFIPSELDPFRFYHSSRFRTSSHLCACGCGIKVVLPIREEEWHLLVAETGFTLDPSVGNRELACRSHYRIIDGRVKWYQTMSDREVELSRAHDFIHRQKAYAKVKPKFWMRPLTFAKTMLKAILDKLR